MPGVRIRVESGPDEGLEVALSRAEVRIGRGAGSNVLLNDQGVLGTLRVWFQSGVYNVSNEIETTVGRPAELRLLPADGPEEWPFPPRTETVWFANQRIRLTDETCLVLTTDEDLNLPDGRHEITRSRSAGDTKKKKDLITIVLSVVLFGAAGLLFTMDTDPGPGDRADRDVGKDYRTLDKHLVEIQKDSRSGRHATVVLGLLRDARLAEIANRKGEAAERYVQARDELNRLIGPPDGPSGVLSLSPEEITPFRKAQEFVAERLLELKDSLTRDRTR